MIGARTKQSCRRTSVVVSRFCHAKPNPPPTSALYFRPFLTKPSNENYVSWEQDETINLSGRPANILSRQNYPAVDTSPLLSPATCLAADKRFILGLRSLQRQLFRQTERLLVLTVEMFPQFPFALKFPNELRLVLKHPVQVGARSVVQAIIRSLAHITGGVKYFTLKHSGHVFRENIV
jgi:hypothetical protein